MNLSRWSWLAAVLNCPLSSSFFERGARGRGEGKNTTPSFLDYMYRICGGTVLCSTEGTRWDCCVSAELQPCRGGIWLACFFKGCLLRLTSTRLKGSASASLGMVPEWLVSGAGISLLVAQLFLINLNIYTQSKLLSITKFVTCMNSCVV